MTCDILEKQWDFYPGEEKDLRIQIWRFNKETGLKQPWYINQLPDDAFTDQIQVSLPANPDNILLDNQVANEIQTISFNTVPDAGSFTINFDGEITASILFSDGAAAVETALEGLTNITDVTVTGSFAAGFTVEWVGVNGNLPQPVMVLDDASTLLTGAAPVTVSFLTTQEGSENRVTIENNDLGIISLTVKADETALMSNGSIVIKIGEDITDKFRVALAGGAIVRNTIPDC